MNILDSLLSSQAGQTVKQFGQQIGLEPEKAEAVVRRLVPALSGSVQRNASQPGGLESLQQALSSGQHHRYVDDPSALKAPEAVEDGNGILGHLLGSKDASRDVAGRVAADTGVDTSIVKKLLPVVAAAAMGVLSKQTARGQSLNASSLGGLLSGLFGGEGGTQQAGQGAAGLAGDLLKRGKKLI
ncbi:MAG TPA: DUF937 domain-containing protein [Gammaproteobacteria bacterium]|nr:DUF937 domain-containing protein [Gammaproteobacteria bacterium]